MQRTIFLPINMLIQFVMSLITVPKSMVYMRRYDMLYTYLKSAMDYRFHDYYHSREGVLELVDHFESIVKVWFYGRRIPETERLEVKRLLCTLYCDLMKLHLMRGDIELACLTVIRANHFLGIDRLPNMPDFDLKTAHVVKAGIAASRLLEEGGLATLMLRQGDEPIVSAPKKPKKKVTTISNVLPFRKK